MKYDVYNSSHSRPIVINRGFVIYFFLFFLSGYSQLMAELIKNPKFTHIEKNYVELIKVGEILTDEFHDELIIARPIRVISDTEASIYVLDSQQRMIFKFSKDLKFVRTIGSQGQGPSELSPARTFLPEFSFGLDGNLYITDRGNGKFIVFSKAGEHIRDIKWRKKDFGSFKPVVDKKGNIFLFTDNDGVLQKVSKNLKTQQTYLDRKLYNRFLLYEPQSRPGRPNSWIIPGGFNTFYDLTSTEKLIVYIMNSSTIYIINPYDGTIIRKFDVWPRKKIEAYRELIKLEKSEGKKNKYSYTAFMGRFFLDKDNDNFFYIDGGTEQERGIRVFYKFNLEGKLVKILFIREPLFLYEKRNGLFYGRSYEKILIYKESEEKR